MKYPIRMFTLLLGFTLLVACTGNTSQTEDPQLTAKIEAMIQEYGNDGSLSPEAWREKAIFRAKRELARDENTLPEFLQILAEDESVNIRVWIAANPKTPVEALKKFLTDEDASIRNYLATNKGLPMEFLDQLSRDEDGNVRQAAAINPSNSQENLKLLAEDPEDNVQQYLARNKNMSEEVMLTMAEKSGVSALKIFLTARDDIPQNVIEALKNHQHSAIRSKAMEYEEKHGSK